MSRNWSSRQEMREDLVAFLSLFHTMLGVVVWDYVSTFEYELRVWLGKHKYLWTIWLYSGCRLFLLLWLFTLALQQNGGVTSHCTVFFIVCALCSYIAIGMASLIIALRVIAIWRHDKAVKVVAYSLIIVSFALNMRDLSLVWIVFLTIIGLNSLTIEQFLPNGVGILATDVLLVMLMLVGLIRLEEARQFGIARFLYHQGLLWFVLVVIAEVPSVAFVALNLNDVLNTILHPFEVSALCICATRMYRSLTSYKSELGSLHIPTTVKSSLRFQSPPVDAGQADSDACEQSDL